MSGEPELTRVYLKEKVHAHTTDVFKSPQSASLSAARHITDVITDRVPGSDVTVEISEIDTEGFLAEVFVYQPVMKGEFKSYELARDWLCRQKNWNHTEVEIVRKFSKRDFELSTFGSKLMT